ncbi:MAG TPA: AtpZ/AtpI family protein [Caulobacteraceae bacterium]|nr:AtpZ/AtpI family protein [Caulobacteraceae bacterium]
MSDPEVPREEALRRLDERADALEARTARTVPDYGFKAAGYGYRLLAEMLGGVFVGLALGLFVDGFAGTAPWGIIGGTLLGFGVSIWMAMRSARRLGAKLEKETGPARDLPFDDEDDD